MNMNLWEQYENVGVFMTLSMPNNISVLLKRHQCYICLNHNPKIPVRISLLFFVFLFFFFKSALRILVLAITFEINVIWPKLFYNMNFKKKKEQESAYDLELAIAAVILQRI